MAKVKDAQGMDIDFEAAAALMDDDLREELHMELAPCSEQEFIERYAMLHAERLGEEWAPFAGGEW